MKTSVFNCARCGQDHQELEFTRLKRPEAEWTHWAVCPNTGEPVLLKSTIKKIDRPSFDPRQTRPL